MTQQEQLEFEQSLESAEAWIQVAHERLKQNDNTRGPRDALEARVHATEEICESAEEGRMKVDMVVAAAELLLKTSDEDERLEICDKLRRLKARWEETSTYITHCHSRVEWVWLHWGEYLKAYEELWAWLLRLRLVLTPELELQLGLQEKIWQLEHHRVLLEDAQHHSTHLQRLLEEAEALHVRTEDESVGQEARGDLEAAFNEVLQKAKDRVSVLEKIVEEQRAYNNLVEDFRSWLTTLNQRANQSLVAEDKPESKTKTLQDLYLAVCSREPALCHIESVAIKVKHNSSPGGAELATQETEALREAWEELRKRLATEQKAQHEQQQSQEEHAQVLEQLEVDVARLRELTQKYGQDLEMENGVENGGEENLLEAWRKSCDILSAMAAEETCVEQLKMELRKLFRFSHDTSSVSDPVLACIKEFQGVKSRGFRMCAEREARFIKHLQQLLQNHERWNQVATKLLEATFELSDSTNIPLLLENVEKLLKHRHPLQESQRRLPLVEDLSIGLSEPKKAQGLLDDLAIAFRTREQLYEKLLERASYLQDMLMNTDQFDKGFESLWKHLEGLKQRLASLGTLKPNLEAKQNQCEQIKLILSELDASQADLKSLEALSLDNPLHVKRLILVVTEWNNLHSTCKVRLKESSQGTAEHEELSHSLLDLEDWLRSVQATLDTSAGEHEGPHQHRAITDIEMDEFLEREMQMHQTEALGKRVLNRTSEDGHRQILADLRRIREAWDSIHALSSQFDGGPGFLDRSPGSLSASSLNREVSQPVSDASDDAALHGLGYGAGEGNTGYFSRAPISATNGRGLTETDSPDVSCRYTLTEEVEGELPPVAMSGSSLKHRQSNPKEEAEPTVMNSGGVFLADAVGAGVNDVHAQKVGAAACRHRQAFEAWLKKGNAELSKISACKGRLKPKQRQAQLEKLQVLRNNLAQGHELFQRMTCEGVKGQELEDLQYYWILYKSKLQEFGDLYGEGELRVARDASSVAQSGVEGKYSPEQRKPLEMRKLQKKSGFLQRVCCAALPLQLLLLALLLLAFLLPLTEESASCSLVNNFARSFKVMLRHDGLPPT